MMTTCPVYLNECEELRKLDSLELVVVKNEVDNLNYDNIQLKNKVNKLQSNVIKFSIISFASGILLSIFAL